MTGLHALHMIIGIGVLALAARAVAGRGSYDSSTTTRWSARACTGTSWTSSGSSSSRCSICSGRTRSTESEIRHGRARLLHRQLYFLVFAALMVLTAVTVLVAYVRPRLGQRRGGADASR